MYDGKELYFKAKVDDNDKQVCTRIQRGKKNKHKKTPKQTKPKTQKPKQTNKKPTEATLSSQIPQ